MITRKTTIINENITNSVVTNVVDDLDYVPSWFVVILWLVLFFPLGFYLLYKKIKQKEIEKRFGNVKNSSYLCKTKTDRS